MWRQPPSAVRRAQHGGSVAPLLLLLLRRIARRIRLSEPSTRRRGRTIPESRGRRAQAAAVAKATARLTAAAILPVDVGRLAESLQHGLVRGPDQPPLILRRIVNKDPIFIFFLVIEFAVGRVLDGTVAGDSDDGPADDLS